MAKVVSLNRITSYDQKIITQQQQQAGCTERWRQLRHAERGERDGMPRTSGAISHLTCHGWSRALRELYMLVPCMCCIAHDAKRQAQGMHIDGHGSAQHGPCAPSKAARLPATPPGARLLASLTSWARSPGPVRADSGLICHIRKGTSVAPTNLAYYRGVRRAELGWVRQYLIASDQ